MFTPHIYITVTSAKGELDAVQRGCYDEGTGLGQEGSDRLGCGTGHTRGQASRPLV